MTNRLGGGVWVIDASTNSVIANIASSNSSNYSLAIAPDGSRGYVAGLGSGQGFVDVVDLKTNTITATLSVGVDSPTTIAITGDGGRIYVGTDVGHVFVFDTSSNSMSAKVNISNGLAVEGIAFTPNGSHLYLTSGDSAVYVMDANTYAVVSKIASSDPALGLAIVGAQ